MDLNWPKGAAACPIGARVESTGLVDFSNETNCVCGGTDRRRYVPSVRVLVYVSHIRCRKCRVRNVQGVRN